MGRLKSICGVLALLTACGLGASSFYCTYTITANMLVLVAQFLLYSLTIWGFADVVKFIINHMHK